MKDAGLKINEIAMKIGIPRNTVRSTLKRFASTGSTKERQWTGRPRVTDAQDDHDIQLSHLRDRFQTAVYTSKTFQGINGKISRSTVFRRLKAVGIKARKPATRPTLTVKHKRARLAWCQEHVIWNHNQWRRVYFTDESPFGVQTKGENSLSTEESAKDTANVVSTKETGMQVVNSWCGEA